MRISIGTGKWLMTRRLFSFISAALIATGLAATWYWLRDKNPVEYLSGNEVSFRPNDDWTAICISSWHEYPDSQRQGFGGGPCWGDTEVPLNEIYITYLMKDGTCLRRIIVGSFLSEGQKITRCYSRAESKGWRFVKTNGVVQVDIEESLE